MSNFTGLCLEINLYIPKLFLFTFLGGTVHGLVISINLPAPFLQRSSTLFVSGFLLPDTSANSFPLGLCARSRGVRNLSHITAATTEAAQPSSAFSFGSVTSGLASFVEAATKMAVSRATTPARHGSPMRSTTPGRATTPGAMLGDLKSAAKNVMANQSRPRLLGGMPPVCCPRNNRLILCPSTSLSAGLSSNAPSRSRNRKPPKLLRPFRSPPARLARLPNRYQASLSD